MKTCRLHKLGTLKITCETVFSTGLVGQRDDNTPPLYFLEVALEMLGGDNTKTKNKTNQATETNSITNYCYRMIKLKLELLLEIRTTNCFQ